jgi:hypothetical protein
MTSVKYIGLDVRKHFSLREELRRQGSNGKVIETKASTILQFIDGLRGDLRVTFEEGTWAAWLYDLLKPRVTEVVVCNPRKNALLKDGSKSDRIDANVVRTAAYEQHQIGLSRRAWLANVERVGAQLSNGQQGSHSGDESSQGDISQLGHSLCRHGSLCTTVPCGMARQDHRTRCTPAGGVLLPAARCLMSTAPGSTAGFIVGSQEAQGLETAAPDSGDRSDSSRGADGRDADASSLPHQATAVELQRAGAGNT